MKERVCVCVCERESERLSYFANGKQTLKTTNISTLISCYLKNFFFNKSLADD